MTVFCGHATLQTHPGLVISLQKCPDWGALKQLGILIITFQCERYITPLLESLAATIDRSQCVIWMLDNASTDTTVETITRERKRLDLPIYLSHIDPNIGYACAANQALTSFHEEVPCEIIVMLNPDMVVHPGWWQPLVAALENRQVGTASSLLLLPDGTINSCGNALHFLGLGFVQGYAAPVSEVPQHPKLFFGSGAAQAFRMATLDKVNVRLGTTKVFWEDLFIYAEDTDLGWRMRLAGFDNVLVTSSRVTHDHQFWVERANVSGDRFYFIERNRYLILLANFKLATLFLLLPWIIASEIALAAGVWKLYPNRLRLWGAVLAEAGTTRFWDRRKRLQRGRQVTDREILEYMTGSIRHGAMPFRNVDQWMDAALRKSHEILCYLIRW
jgi:GT2 family glycosyltransferase